MLSQALYLHEAQRRQDEIARAAAYCYRRQITSLIAGRPLTSTPLKMRLKRHLAVRGREVKGRLALAPRAKKQTGDKPFMVSR